MGGTLALARPLGGHDLPGPGPVRTDHRVDHCGHRAGPDRPVVRVLCRVQGRRPRVLVGQRVEARSRSTQVRHSAAHLGNVRHRLRVVVHCTADRALECDLPQRVRSSQAAWNPQAIARAAGGDPHDRLRLSGVAPGDSGAQGGARADGNPGRPSSTHSRPASWSA